MRFRLMPTDDGFFELFSKAAANALVGAERLRELVTDYTDVSAKHKAVVDCERQGDQYTRDILHRLDTTFVTPFDREDIHALAEEIDDVIDDIHHVSDLLTLLPFDNLLPELKEQADVLVQAAAATVELLGCLRTMKGTKPHLEAIDRLESEGDGVYRRTMARLFSGDYDALDVLKWKDVVQGIESAINTTEDISDVVESIILKHA